MSFNVVITRVIGAFVHLVATHLTQGELRTDTETPIPVIAQSQIRELSLHSTNFVTMAQSF